MKSDFYMNQEKKDAIYEMAKLHAQETCGRLKLSLVEAEESLRRSKASLRGSAGDIIERRLYLHKLEQRNHLEQLIQSPYFFRCDVTHTHTESKSLYFSKQSFPEADIFSWTTPAATLRFEDIGNATYRMPDGETKSVRLERKDQYLLSGEHLVFMAVEDAEDARTLIHQERLAAKDRGFVLPDIVAQMEKAQDQVIRAESVGPLLISGPAGSGKTTLALHRVAYLAQSPDTSAFFPANEIIVFVQDSSSKSYFSALLPDLGIHGVAVVTYEEWALPLAEIMDASIRGSSYGDEVVNDEYRAAKHAALSSIKSSPPQIRIDGFIYLRDLYKPFLSQEQLRLFEAQMVNRELDRCDLTALLMRKSIAEGSVKSNVEYYDRLHTGRIIKKKARARIRYSLAIVDEAENWVREELLLVRGCIDTETKAVVYVGDISQRTRLGAIATWGDIDESFGDGRSITLHKVYRNTRQILEFVASIGFAVEVPIGLPDGPAVVRKTVGSAGILEHCLGIAVASKGRYQVGILAKNESRLEGLRHGLSEHNNVKIMTVEEAQGVEFDTVALLHMNDFLEKPKVYKDATLSEERARVNRDLLYVALTRAMRELHVLD